MLLGLALASKWVAAYAIGALLLLILIRSALGRVLAILGLIGITAVLGYMAISVPAAAGSTDPGFGNLTFLLIMVALTLLAVVVAVVHPIAWTDEEMRFGVGAPAVLGALVFFGALAAGKLDTTIKLGSISVTPLLVALALAFGSLVVVALFWIGGRWGFGPLAAPPAADDPIRLLDPPGDPAEGWLRPGLAARHPGRLDGRLPGRAAGRRSTSSRTSRGRSSRTRRRRSSRAGRPGTPARRCST